MPTFLARAPKSSLGVLLTARAEGPLPLYTAQDELNGRVMLDKPVKEVTVSLRLCYRLVNAGLLIDWDKTLSPTSTYQMSWAYEIAKWKADPAEAGELAFGPFDLSQTRNWVLSGSAQPGRSYSTAILRPQASHSDLPPSFDVKWHHCFWQICVESIDGLDRRSLLTIPILFFPALPLVPSLRKGREWQAASVSRNVYMLACLGAVGKLRVTLSWPEFGGKKDHVIVAGLAVPVKLVVDLSRVKAGTMTLSDISICSVYLEQRVSNVTGRLDDAVTSEQLHCQWQGDSLSEDCIALRANVLLPDATVTSFDCRPFLLTVRHTLTVSLNVPLSVGGRLDVDFPICVTREPFATPLDEELGRRAKGFCVVQHGPPSRSWWPSNGKSCGAAPLCLSDVDEGLGCAKPTLMITNGDGFPDRRSVT